MKDDITLANVLRKFIDSEHNAVSTNGLQSDAVLILDGYVDLTPEEGRVVWQAMGRTTVGA